MIGHDKDFVQFAHNKCLFYHPISVFLVVLYVDDLLEFPYHERVGALIFLMVCTRADIAYALSLLKQAF